MRSVSGVDDMPAQGYEWHILSSWHLYTSDVILLAYILHDETQTAVNAKEIWLICDFCIRLHTFTGSFVKEPNIVLRTLQILSPPLQHPSKMTGKIISSFPFQTHFLLLSLFLLSLLLLFIPFSCSSYLHLSSLSVLNLHHLRIIPSFPLFPFSVPIHIYISFPPSFLNPLPLLLIIRLIIVSLLVSRQTLFRKTHYGHEHLNHFTAVHASYIRAIIQLSGTKFRIHQSNVTSLSSLCKTATPFGKERLSSWSFEPFYFLLRPLYHSNHYSAISEQCKIS
jgi:hypothetical protein